ncbi:hypothetical protein Xen7305DRAFT_00021390 [Xenococcus sp. PCC 7305]|nr:hypothetical protein Xen7305DRAFT_00021390 [Xenococcus sp. PCC 7305]
MNIVVSKISIKSVNATGGLAPQTPHWGRCPPQTPDKVLTSELEKFDFLGSCSTFQINLVSAINKLSK